MIELRGLTKSFRTVHGRHFVFRDLDLTFHDGVNVGLIGPNGAGKSTLMRLIGGIDTPDRGVVATDQRISFPVGLSGGFQGTLSGRDNAKFVCRLYGVGPQEVREKVSFIEEFAELGKYFDMPIKTYSSGMRSRLIFGLSMAFDFDYYLMDEVGAVGDAGFKEKSRELLESKIGRANVICVSHSMNVIRAQCDVVVLLQHGAACLYEDLEEGIRAYQGDAYVEPANRRAKREKRTKGARRSPPMNIEAILPKDVRRARRILRVVRAARKQQTPAVVGPAGNDTRAAKNALLLPDRRDGMPSDVPAIPLGIPTAEVGTSRDALPRRVRRLDAKDSAMPGEADVGIEGSPGRRKRKAKRRARADRAAETQTRTIQPPEIRSDDASVLASPIEAANTGATDEVGNDAVPEKPRRRARRAARRAQANGGPPEKKANRGAVQNTAAGGARAKSREIGRTSALEP